MPFDALLPPQPNAGALRRIGSVAALTARFALPRPGDGDSNLTFWAHCWEGAELYRGSQLLPDCRAHRHGMAAARWGNRRRARGACALAACSPMH
jgi:hypothetical protein